MLPPARIPASLAAVVLLLGLGLIYWSLRGFGVLQDADASTETPKP